MGDFSENKIFVTLFKFHILVILHDLGLSVRQSRTLGMSLLFRFFKPFFPWLKPTGYFFQPSAIQPSAFNFSALEFQRVYSLPEFQIVGKDFSEFGVEPGGVVHFFEVAEFVDNDIVNEFGFESHEHGREENFLFHCAEAPLSPHFFHSDEIWLKAMFRRKMLCTGYEIFGGRSAEESLEEL